MDQKQQNRLTRDKVLLRYLDKHKTVWQDFAPFKRASDALAASIADRESAAQGQAVPTIGITDDKETAAEMAVDKVLFLARLAKGYALEQKNGDLYKQMKHSRTDLLTTGDNVQGATMQAMLDAMLAAVNAEHSTLGEFKVTADAIADARAAVIKSADALPEPRNAIVEHTTATKAIPDHEKSSRQALAMMNTLVHVFTETNSAFVSGFKQAIVIVDSGTRHEDKWSGGTPPVTG